MEPYIPKCSLISWIAIQYRLTTGDRLVQFGVIDSPCCSFCLDTETHDHLFFNCSFTKQVWESVSLKSQFVWQSHSLSSLISQLSNFQGKGLRSTIAKLSFTVTIYHVWIERNTRKFQNLQHSIPSVVARICLDIRNRLMSLTKIPAGPSTLMESWNLPTDPN